ncbi:MAG: hypothetical protein MZW92_68370 [Comamonadaceae bacterium]|nr:hypothetical protein [Comamonadaceae bacterium]
MQTEARRGPDLDGDDAATRAQRMRRRAGALPDASGARISGIAWPRRPRSGRRDGLLRPGDVLLVGGQSAHQHGDQVPDPVHLVARRALRRRRARACRRAAGAALASSRPTSREGVRAVPRRRVRRLCTPDLPPGRSQRDDDLQRVIAYAMDRLGHQLRPEERVRPGALPAAHAAGAGALAPPHAGAGQRRPDARHLLHADRPGLPVGALSRSCRIVALVPSDDPDVRRPAWARCCTSATTACSHRATSTSRPTSQIVKPVLRSDFDYRSLRWSEDESAPARLRLAARSGDGARQRGCRSGAAARSRGSRTDRRSPGALEAPLRMFYMSRETVRLERLLGAFLLAVFAGVRSQSGVAPMATMLGHCVRSGRERISPNASSLLEQIISGGPPKDGIPAIDKPRFVGFERGRRLAAAEGAGHRAGHCRRSARLSAADSHLSRDRE